MSREPENIRNISKEGYEGDSDVYGGKDVQSPRDLYCDSCNCCFRSRTAASHNRQMGVA